MKYNLETITNTRLIDMEAAAEITAKGFGRENDEDNYLDTEAHLLGADYVQLVHNQETLVGFAAYQRLLWQPCD